jgi:Zn-dependent protease with chaperone function
VLVLILSLVASDRYEMVFRNAAFVVATVLIRFALTEGFPYGAPLAIVAMLFGIVTMLVYNFHVRNRYAVQS